MFVIPFFVTQKFRFFRYNSNASISTSFERSKKLEVWNMDKISYTKFEKMLESEYRERLNESKRIDEVGNTFVEYAFKLLSMIKPDVDEALLEELAFDPDNEKGYRLHEHLRRALEEELENSDLPAILERMAKAALHRYQHIVKDDDRTEVFRKAP